jgi:hypothetical protein
LLWLMPWRLRALLGSGTRFHVSKPATVYKQAAE